VQANSTSIISQWLEMIGSRLQFLFLHIFLLLCVFDLQMAGYAAAGTRPESTCSETKEVRRRVLSRHLAAGPPTGNQSN
jgi:hypothetical protein